MLKPLSFVILASFALPSAAFVDYQTLKFVNTNTQTKVLTDEVMTPWGMEQLPNKDILVTDRSGSLKLIRHQQGDTIELKGLPKIHAKGQGGLLDIALAPDFAQSNWIYMTYSSPEGEGRGSNTALMRAKLNVEKRQIEQVQTLFKAKENSQNGRHFGSRIAFDQQGMVYFSVGDRGDRDENPQDLTRDAGKVYRLHADGSVPKSNPFINKKDVSAAIYSYGHRNPQGMARNPETGSIWSHEHGPRGGDEVNIIRSGENYGWPVVSYGVNYSGTKFTSLTEKEGMVSPVLHWTPSIAPSDMVFVTSDKYPALKGKLLVGSLKYNFVAVIEYKGDNVVSQSKAFKDIGRVRSIMQGNDGFLYIGLDGRGVVKIQPSS